MLIEKCDVCKKEIKEQQQIVVGFRTSWPRLQLCVSCGKPIQTFLEKKKLIAKEKKIGV